MQTLTDDLTNDKVAAVSRDLSAIQDLVITKDNLKVGLVGEEGDIKDSLGFLDKGGPLAGVSALEHGEARFSVPPVALADEPVREGWSTSSAVSFVAKTIRTVRMAHADSPALSVISKMLRSMYLHREIREKGGAYGGFALYSSETGLFNFASYRDPHILATLAAFQGASTFILSGNYTQEDVKEAILQVCSDIDKPDPPGPAAKKAFYRSLINLADDDRRRFKERLLRLKYADIVEAGQRYFSPDNHAAGVAVISNEDKLTKANESISGTPLIIKKI